MGMDPLQLLKMKGMWEKFTARHPKFPAFLKAAEQGAIGEGTVIEITITTAEGKKISSNLKVKAEDMEMFETLKRSMN